MSSNQVYELNFLLEKEQRDNRRQDLIRSREWSRDAIYKTVLMSSSIIGFSLALLSARIFQPNNIDAEIVKDSWIFFVLAIILGVACLIIESHLEFSHTWHVLLYDVTPASEQYTFMEKFKGLLLFLVALLFPANLIVKMKRKNPDSAKRINDITLTYLWTSMRLIFIAEKFVFVLFIVGVIYLIRSYK